MDTRQQIQFKPNDKSKTMLSNWQICQKYYTTFLRQKLAACRIAYWY